MQFLFEKFTKVTAAREATLICDIHNGKIRLPQHRTGNADSIIDQIFKGGKAKLTLETAAAFSCANVRCLGDIVQRDF